MKRAVLLLVAFGHFFCAFAQNTESNSKTHKKNTDFEHDEGCEREEWREFMVNFLTERQGKKTFFSGSVRLIAEKKRIFFDARMGNPHGPTVTLGIGYPIRLKKDGCWVLSPAIYLHAGTFSGVSPGFVMRYEKKRWFIITTNQYLISISKEHSHHLYSVTTFDYRLTKWLEIGGEFEMLYGKEHHPLLQINSNLEYFDHVATREFLFGPQVRLRFKRNLFEVTFQQNMLVKNSQRLVLTYSREF